MNLNSEQTLTEYAVARSGYKAATIEARVAPRTRAIQDGERAPASGLATPAINPSVPRWWSKLFMIIVRGEEETARG